MSIKITIEKTTEKRWLATENVVTKETPTSITKPKDYGSGCEVAFAREFAAVEVTKSATSTIRLLEQVIENDADLDLAAVIVAINKLGAA